MTRKSLLALLLVACSYNPKIPSDVITCTPGKSKCPMGMNCFSLDGNPENGLCSSGLGGAGGDPSDGGGLGGLGGGFGGLGGIVVPVATVDASSAGTPDAPSSPDAGPADAPAGSDTAPMMADAGGGTGCLSPHGPTMVKADGFCIDSTEVTNQQYQEFLTDRGGDTTGQAPNCKANTDFSPTPSVHWPFLMNQKDFPVVNVDWCDAVSYCQWAGKRLCGRVGGGSLTFNFQLDASVSQWQDACSRGGKTPFPYGATYNANACYVKGDPSTRVEAGSTKTCEGGYPGLFDMAGNVEEWIDCCHAGTTGDTCLIMGGSFQSAQSAQPGCGTWYEDARLSPNQRRGFRCCN